MLITEGVQSFGKFHLLQKWTKLSVRYRVHDFSL